MLHTINYFFTRLFDVILYPFTFVNDFWGVLFLSAISSLVVLVVYKYLSSPEKIKDSKDKIKANILAIRLYRDFWKVILTSFGKSVLYTLKYFSLNLLPLIVVLPILAPMFAQMDVRYGMRPFNMDEVAVVKAYFNEDVENLDIKLVDNGAVKLLMNPVFVKAEKQVNWKVAVRSDKAIDLEIKVGDTTYKKALAAGNYKGAISNKKFSHSNIEHMMYPAEPLFNPAKELDAVYVGHPGKTINFLGTRIHWLWHYLVWVLVIVLGLRKKFGVEF